MHIQPTLLKKFVEARGITARNDMQKLDKITVMLECIMEAMQQESARGRDTPEPF